MNTGNMRRHHEQRKTPVGEMAPRSPSVNGADLEAAAQTQTQAPLSTLQQPQNRQCTRNQSVGHPRLASDCESEAVQLTLTEPPHDEMERNRWQCSCCQPLLQPCWRSFDSFLAIKVSLVCSERLQLWAGNKGDSDAACKHTDDTGM